ncbi:flagellar basal body P-ring biosynthesis protein FlgA [Planctomycetes bacterium Poly30]|uniref:Flagellar basal body P-ring biosynthesis protein FlgA n=1 Tax=Saltatorellus ferox TaxID=2528018 RepID=A0A518F0W0_9BACT|nr:flagellar basal body P-ring biosynthesis protein FlgA [Planctomycetes bacterium Poly30]
MMLLTVLSLLTLGGVSVELPASSTSKGMEIHVAEIAKVTGDDPELVARVEAASLGYAPAPGFHRTLRADLVQASLRSVLPGVEIRVTGAPRCRVTPGVQFVKGIDMQGAAAKRLREALAGQDAEATPTGALADLQVPTSSTPPSIVVPMLVGSTFPGIRSVPVEIWLDGKLYRTVNVSFNVSIWQRRAILSRAVSAGEPLHAGLFQIKRVAVDSAQGMFALETSALAGAVALKALPAGVSVSERDVHREVVVHRGDIINVRVIKGHVEVSDIAVAQADGRMGERLAVVIQSTGRELTAVVKGPRAVEVRIQ